MLHHMTMEQPQSRIVGDEDEIRLFTGSHQIGVTKHIPRFLAKFLRCDPEMVTMKMHGMFPASVVPHAKNGDLAKVKIRQAQAVSSDFAIEGPELGMFLCQLAERHLLALEGADPRLPMAPPCM